ncbi:MAG TPA: SulP family inorganic anion transporter, partial [Anaerolineae bacterium]
QLNIIQLFEGFQPSRLLPSVTAGLVTGIITVIFQISFAALIFSGPLAIHVTTGIGLTLIGAIILTIVVALTSSLPCAIAIPQDTPAAILALTAAAISRSMSPSATSDAIFLTVVAAMGMTSLFTGSFFYALGRFKLGRLIRFVPYPVIGGFLAGTGWLLVQGSIGVMTGTAFSFAQPGLLLQPDAFAMWVPGLIFAVLLLVILRRHKHYMIVPTMLVSAILVFYVILWLSGTPIPEATRRGWLLGSFSQGALWQPFTPAALSQVDWSILLGQMDKIGTILIVSVIGLLLNTTALELDVRQDIDLNRELESAGVGNIIAGLAAAPPGFQTLSLSDLAYRTGSNSRLVGLVSAGFCALILVAGSSLLSFFPRPLLGGLVLFQGLSFVIEWVYAAWFKLPMTDYVLILLILTIVVTVGYLPGVAVGIGVAILLFVMNYSRTQIVRHVFTGTNYHSAVERPILQRRILREKGSQLYILRLQGFVFFGTDVSLLNQVRQRLADPDLPLLRFVVLDFGRVDGVDSSAVSGFVRIKQLVEPRDIQLVFSGLTADMRRQLERGGLGKQADGIHFFPTLDQGVEWCEDQILAAEPRAATAADETLTTELERVFSRPSQITAFKRYLERMQVTAGYCLMRQGDPSDSFYFIESGLVTAQFQSPDGQIMRLRTMRAGTVVGEVGLYQKSIRTASAFTIQPSTLYRLSGEAIEKMESQDPELASALHHFIAHLMAERLADNNNMLTTMMD